MKDRIYNFAAGPSMLADEVLDRLYADFYSYQDSGMAVMEMSHRAKDYLAVFSETKDRLRKIMAIGEDYEIFFMHGGATGQFAAVPLNLMKKGKADYIVTGNFAKKAAQEAGLDYQIDAHPLSETANFGPDADMILLGPQVMYKLKDTQKQFPDKPVEAIKMQDYGMMRGDNVIKRVREVLGDSYENHR